MKLLHVLAASILATSTPGATMAQAADPAHKPQAKKTKPVNGPRVMIPFVATNGLYNWQAGKDNTLLLEAHHNDWYKVTFQGYCPPLKFENQIGVIVDPMGSFDKFSKVLVDDTICYVDTLERVPNPRKAAKTKTE